MSESLNGHSRIDGWKGIADYVGRDVTTVIRWAKVHGLPVNRAQPGQPRRGVFALRHDLDAWMAGQQGTAAAATADHGVTGEPSPNAGTTSIGNSVVPVEKQPFADISLDPPIAAAVEAGIVGLDAKVRSRRRMLAFLVAGTIGLILIVAGFIWLRAGPLATTPRFSNPEQLTFNGLRKQGLETDGKRLYFGEAEDGWLALASMSIHGGTIKVLWHPDFSVVPVGYSRSANALLLAGFQDGDIEYERQIWVYPLGGQRPYRVGKIRAHSAVWSPDGKEIAYASGKAIYLSNAEGTDERELASFSGLPDMLQWSRDGRQLHFLLQNPVTTTSSMYEILFSNGVRAFSVRRVPWSLGFDYGYEWSPTGRRGTFALGGSGATTDYAIYFVHYRTHWWEPPIRTKTAHSPLPGIVYLAMPPSDTKLFVMNSAVDQHGVMEYDPHTKRMQYILKNDSVGYIDPSRNGKWLVWIGLYDHGLTIARTDGSQEQSFSSLNTLRFMELPRWSPDGREVAFMGKRSHHPWRDYILRVSDGVLREASKGNDNQGAPTWSPDGKYLLYGNVGCLGAQTCAIHRIDLATGNVETIPGSSGLMTARWSPNGKYIAALQPTRHQLMLFDVATQKWRVLATGINGADISWMANSQYVYADVMGANARIVRVDINSGTQKTVLELNQIARFNLKTAHGSTFCPGPHGTLILPWPSPVTEIYSYNVEGM